MVNRLHLATMEKETATKLRDMSYQEFVDIYLEGKQNNYMGVNDLPFSEDLYRFERYVEFEIMDVVVDPDVSVEIEDEVFFRDSKLANYYYCEDQNIYEIGKEGLLKLIAYYRLKVIEDYKHSLGYPPEANEYYSMEKTNEEKQTAFINRKLAIWINEKNDPINLEQTGNGLTNTFCREYTIFTFIHLLKTIDFDKQTLLMYSF